MVVSATSDGAARFDLQTVINRAAATLRAHGPALVLGGLLMIGGTMAACRFLERTFLADLTAADAGGLHWRVFAAAELQGFVEGVAGALVTAWVALVVIADQTDPTTADPRAALGQVFRRALPITILSVLLQLAILFGFILVIVPGLMVALGCVVATPVQVVEGRSPFQSLSRSWRLTQNHRGGVFALMLIWSVPLVIVEFILAKLFGGGASFARALQTPVMSLAVLPILSALAEIASAAGIASAYVELVTIKEGGFVSSIGEVFA